PVAPLRTRRGRSGLARHYFGSRARAARRAAALPAVTTDSAAVPADDRADSTHEPSRLLDWSEFHQCVEALPPAEREVFNLLWYHGMTQSEAAAVLDVSVPTVTRWWLSARP